MLFDLIEATDPAGDRERLEFQLHDETMEATAPSNQVPTGFSASNASLNYWNTFYWDKKAMAVGAGDRSKAVTFNWMLGMDVSYGHAMTRPLLQSVKRPLDNRVWYRYAGQDAASHHVLGTQPYPTLIGRVLDGGVSQVKTITFNAQGSVTAVTDPLGRQTTYTYDTSGLNVNRTGFSRGLFLRGTERKEDDHVCSQTPIAERATAQLP